MASLKLISNNSNLSYLIKKNPESGIRVKTLKRGRLFGWYKKRTDNLKEYDIYFEDSPNEISFKRNKYQEYEYINSSKYNSPVFVINAIREYFQSAMNENSDKLEGYNYQLEITSVEIRNRIKIESIIRQIVDINQITIELKEIEQRVEKFNEYRIYKVTINSNSLFSILNFSYLFFSLITAINGIEISTDYSYIERLVKSSNLINSSYYIKYLIKFYFIKSEKDFSRIKDELNYSKSDLLDIKNLSNFELRRRVITDYLINRKDYNIVDLGAGEGRYLKLAERLEDNKIYYAIDLDERMRRIIKRKVIEKDYKNVVILESIEDFLDLNLEEDFIVLMTEVFEHNELDYNKSLLNKLFSNPFCKEIIITTPNREFNKNYSIEGLRHEDHKFELAKEELIDWLDNNFSDINYRIENLGDEVNGVSTSLIVKIKKKNNKEG